MKDVHISLLSTRQYPNDFGQAALMSPIIAQCKVAGQHLCMEATRLVLYLNGCSALKRLAMVGLEKGTLDSSFGEDPVDEREGIRSICRLASWA